MRLYVSYMRVSTQRQGRSGLGLAAQKKMIGDFIDEHGQLVGEFIEIETGNRDNREILWKAIDEAQKRKARLLIARLDRFSRRVSFIAQIMERDIGLTVVEMPNATDFRLHIFAALAQEERRLISLRTRAALQQAKLQGKKLGLNGQVLAKRRRECATDYGMVLRDALGERVLSWTYSEMARYLTNINFPTRGGGKWSAQTVKNYLVRDIHPFLVESSPSQH
jgi:DNA invertase Pin-like site-specific DNA recombinase